MNLKVSLCSKRKKLNVMVKIANKYTLFIGLEADKDNENTCQGCGGNYDDEAEDSQRAWIG